MTTPAEPVAIRAVFGGLTDEGLRREHNEDYVLIRVDLGLFIVADGMGGHSAGDVASKIAASSLAQFFEETRGATDFGPVPPEYEHLDLDARRLLAGIHRANQRVHQISSRPGAQQGMGSTIVVAHITRDGMVHIGHVGDSRCYRVCDGEIELLTYDHSFVNDILLVRPDITQEEINRLPKNIITRALGMAPTVEPSLRSEPTVPGDVYVLCSDGLSGMVSDDEILEIVGNGDDPKRICKELIDAANEAGGVDNISAVVVRIDEARPSGSAATVCPACGFSVPVGTQRCPRCGAALR